MRRERQVSLSATRTTFAVISQHSTEFREEDMALAITINDIDGGAQNIYVFGTLTASGNYAAGGDTLDFTSVASQLASSQAPIQVWIGGSTGDAYSFIRAASPTLANGKVKLSTASNTELSAGAYPARITGDTNLMFEAVFQKML
jgi:hypothetical protein